MPNTTPPRFWPPTIAFPITRAGDLWSTGIWMDRPGGEAGEMNPLSSILGFTFWPLVISNVLVSGVLLYGHWWYCGYYTVRSTNGTPKDRWEFLSLVFYKRPDHARYLLFRSGSTPTLYYAQLAHVLVRTVAVVSVLAILHNLGQFHSWAINDTLRNVLVRPALVIYAIGAAIFLYFYLRMAEREFKTWQNA